VSSSVALGFQRGCQCDCAESLLIAPCALFLFCPHGREWTLNGDAAPVLNFVANTAYTFTAASDYDNAHHLFGLVAGGVEGQTSTGIIHDFSGATSTFSYTPMASDKGATISYICEYHLYFGNKINVSAAFGMAPSVWVVLLLLAAACGLKH
jgi:hypothetical protein